MNRPTVEFTFRLALLPVILFTVALLAPLSPAHAQAAPSSPESAYAFDPTRNLEPAGGDISLHLLQGILGSVIGRVRLADSLSAIDKAILTDPQTAGPLLVACAPEAVEQVLAIFRAEGFGDAVVIGEMQEGSTGVSVI